MTASRDIRVKRSAELETEISPVTEPVLLQKVPPWHGRCCSVGVRSSS